MLFIIVIPSISLWTSTCSWEGSERILGLWCWRSGQESRLEREAKLELSMVLILLAAWSAASWPLVLNLVANHFAFTLIGTPSTLVKPLIFWLQLYAWPPQLLTWLTTLSPTLPDSTDAWYVQGPHCSALVSAECPWISFLVKKEPCFIVNNENVLCF